MKLKNGAISAFWAAGALLLALSFAQPAAAQTIGSIPPPGDLAPINDNHIAGQLIVPPSALPLESFSFWVERDTSNPSFLVTPYVYEWKAGAPDVSPLWTGVPINVTSLTPVQITFSPNLVLDPAKKYAVLLENTNPGESGWLDVGTADQAPGYRVHGKPWAEFPLLETHFTARFGPPVPAAVPTMSEWGMILLGVLLAGGAALVIQKRRFTV